VKTEGKRQIGRRRCRWYIDWVGLAQDKEVGSFAYGNEPSGSKKCGEFLD
jgi:hypothetical protein